jgi:molybdopterin synthase sulfur carrier subunit
MRHMNAPMVKLLYFVQLPDVFGKDQEEVFLPKEVTNVQQLLEWLRSRGKQYNDLLKDDIVTVTINKSFAEPFTILEEGDEIAIVPKPN